MVKDTNNIMLFFPARVCNVFTLIYIEMVNNNETIDITFTPNVMDQRRMRGPCAMPPVLNRGRISATQILYISSSCL